MRFFSPIFSKIANRDDALRLIRRSSTLFFIFAGMQIILSLFLLSQTPKVRNLASIPADFVTNAVGTVIIIVVLATILRVFNSRIAATMLVLLSIIIAASTVLKLAPGNTVLAFVGIFVAIRATYATFKLHGQFASNKDDQHANAAKSYDVEKWQTLLKYDKDVALIAEKLLPLGEKWVDQFAYDFLALNDKRYLRKIVQKIIADVRKSAERAEAAERSRRDWPSTS